MTGHELLSSIKLSGPSSVTVREITVTQHCAFAPHAVPAKVDERWKCLVVFP